MKQKLFLTSVIAILCSANAWADTLVCQERPGPSGDPFTPTYTPGMYADDCEIYTCSTGHYCPGTKVALQGKTQNLKSCPSNYDNTATGLKSIEECCLNAYDSSTGLCGPEGTFPSSGLMRENKTYYNAATSTNMDGVYSGTVNAVAEYEDIFYDIVAGNYLAAGSDDEDGTICPAGSYCSGLTHAPYNATSDQGKTSCPTDYALSAAGATSADECYRQCTASDVAHSKSTGTFTGMFYSNNTNACEPVNDASCENGYHYKEGSTGLNVDGMIAGDSYNEDSSTMTWDTTFIYGNITGKALCSTTNGEWATTGTPDETESGGNCWCKIDGFTPVNGSKQSLSGAWVLASRRETDNCVDDCTGLCASVCQNNLIMRGSLLGTVQSTPAMCEANTITINWSNADAEDISANNAGTATYGEDVRTPVKAETIKGKTFKGWRFSKPEQTPLP